MRRQKGNGSAARGVFVAATRIASLRAQGRSWSQIVDELGVGKGTAQRALAGLPKKETLAF
jgi:hypothetical protein